MDDWERAWAPYDERTYQAALAFIQPDDVVLDIGAGDLRFALRLAERAVRVYALELQLPLLRRTLASLGGRLPVNLSVVCGDARYISFPPNLTVAVLLMRHCQHFTLYANKLKNGGCQRLITNARWRLGMEEINLLAERIPFQNFDIGWYTCWCGAVGFKPGPVELMTSEVDDIVHEVQNCPQCASTQNL